MIDTEADLLPELDQPGWWIARPVEQPARPLRFEHGRNVQSMLRVAGGTMSRNAWWRSTPTIRLL